VTQAYPLAIPAVDATLMTSSTDAATEATRRQALFGVQRYWYDIPMFPSDIVMAVDIGQVVTVQTERFGMTSGKKMIVLGINADAASSRITFSVWG
jgi:hypothetical protein